MSVLWCWPGFFTSEQYGRPPLGEAFLDGETSAELLGATVLQFVRLKAATA